MGIMDTISGAIYGGRHAAANELLSNISFADRFTATISSPVSIPTLFESSGKDSYRIMDIEIPDSTIEVEATTYGGIFKNIAANKKQDSINVTFIDSNQGELRYKFFKWQKAIFDADTGRLGYYNEYISNNIQLNIHSMQDLNNYSTVYFTEAYPITVGGVQYNRTTPGPVTFKVAFTFKRVYYSFTSQNREETGVLSLIKKIKSIGSEVVDQIGQIF